MKICIISDTHSLHNQITHKLPEADCLIFAGDMCNVGYLHEVQYFADWLDKIKSRFISIIIVAGNHDWPFQKEPNAARKYIEDTGAIYLENKETIVNGFKVWGSPATREFCNWSFNYTEEELKEIWKTIPNDVDILVTHSMPKNILDFTPHGDVNVGEVGLVKRIKQLKDLKLYIGGNLHYHGGETKLVNGVLYVNAAVCDERYKPIQGPVVLNIDETTKQITLIE